MSIIVNLVAARICRIPDDKTNEAAISIALGPFLRRYPKSIKAIKLELADTDFQNLAVQVEAADMGQAGEMNVYLNKELLVTAGFTSPNWADAAARAALSGVDPNRKPWWQFWKT